MQCAPIKVVERKKTKRKEQLTVVYSFSLQVGSALPALASDTALDIALEEMALFLFMISSNSASFKGPRDDSMSLQKVNKEISYFCSQQ